jgi:TolA-binding protein
MTASSAPARIEAALAARRRTTDALLRRVRETVSRMQREGTRPSVAAIARHADVSRTFLYQHPEARTLIHNVSLAATGQRTAKRNQGTDRTDTAWQERALNAEHAVKEAHQEIRRQRDQIAQLLGRVRDLELDLPNNAIQRVVTENTTLMQRVRQLAQDNQRLEDRLKGARDNNRFLDKRIADLETELAEYLTRAMPGSTRKDSVNND